MTIQLLDDGTLDTVFECTDCSSQFRFNYQSEHESFGDIGTDTEKDYQLFVEYCQQELESEHDCNESE